MWKAKLLVGLMLVAGPAWAHEPVLEGLKFTGGYDYYVTPNGGNNYDDGQGFSLGITHSYTERIKGRALFSHLTDIHFPVSDDPKGSFGELRGFGGIYDWIFSFPTGDTTALYLFGGVGYYTWDFKENPFLQDNSVTVDTDDSVALRGGLGFSFQASEAWTLGVELSWFDTNIDKDARDASGREWHILDDDGIGLQYIGVSVKGAYEF